MFYQNQYKNLQRGEIQESHTHTKEDGKMVFFMEVQESGGVIKTL